MSVCFKCLEAAGTIVSRDGVNKLYCADCFSQFCTKMVRNALLTQCQLPSHVPIAVAVSGGPSSMLLMHQLGLLRCHAARRHGSDGMQLVLVPFHLNESELVLPPRPHIGRDQRVPEEYMSNDNAEATRSLYASMAEQFERLQAYACEQPLQWEWASAPLFAKDEMRVFHYSDFVARAAISTLATYLHHIRLGLTDREEVYARVRQRVLCLAAHRVVQQWYAAHPSQRDEHPSRTSSDGVVATTARRTRENAETSSNVGDVMPSNAGCDTCERRRSGPSQASAPAPRACASGAQTPAHWVHLLLGSHAVGVSVDVLHELIRGAGGSGVTNVGGYRSYVHGTVMLRPLRTLMPKEIVLYHRQHHTEEGGGTAAAAELYTPALVTGTSFRSVRRTLEASVQRMARSYPSMVFNVLSTVGKLRVQPDSVASVVRGVGGLSTTRGRAAQASYRYTRQTIPPPICYTSDAPPAESTTGHDAGPHPDSTNSEGRSSRDNTPAGRVLCCLLCGYPYPVDQLHPTAVVCTRPDETGIVLAAADEGSGASTHNTWHVPPPHPKRRRFGVGCEAATTATTGMCRTGTRVATGCDNEEDEGTESEDRWEGGTQAADELAVYLCDACLPVMRTPATTAASTSLSQPAPWNVVCDVLAPFIAQ